MKSIFCREGGNIKEKTTDTMLAISYQVLRQEQVATLNKETNVMAYYISAMGVICGFGLNALQQDTVNARISCSITVWW